MPNKERKGPYWKIINRVIDPEAGIGVVDMGLIYNIEIDKEKNATVTMTLTSPACPVGPHIMHQIEDIMRQQDDINNVEVKLVWSPIWTPEMIDEDLREMMFGL